MTDPALHALLAALPAALADGPVLWVADEHAAGIMPAVTAHPALTLLTNRWDVAAHARAQGIAAHFADMDFAVLAGAPFRHVLYRVSKEKPVVHHVINGARHVLLPGGQLQVFGLKAEGTKTYGEKARAYFGNGCTEKHGPVYVVQCEHSGRAPGSPLDDQDYPQLREIATPALTFWSKPGVFGWNRIDPGSAFLVEHLPAMLATLPAPPRTLLDPGCGYGYLTLASRDLALTRRVATDTNAAALAAMQRNADAYGLAVDVIAADGVQGVQGPFDLVLCNPPFHQGFAIEQTLTTRFLADTARVLSAQGAALFVVNTFIPLEKEAQPYFSRIGVLAHNRSFKLVRLAL